MARVLRFTTTLHQNDGVRRHRHHNMHITYVYRQGLNRAFLHKIYPPASPSPLHRFLVRMVDLNNPVINEQVNREYTFTVLHRILESSANASFDRHGCDALAYSGWVLYVRLPTRWPSFHCHRMMYDSTLHFQLGVLHHS
jgi:hypothetical protein